MYCGFVGTSVNLAQHTTKGFFARKIGDMQRSPTDDTIIYEEVELNLVNNYNVLTGEYRVPSNGIYFFFMNAVTLLPGSTDVRLLQSSREVSRAYASFSTDSQSGSLMAVLHCLAGHTMYTVLERGNSLKGNRWSHWGGFYVY